MFRSYRNCYSIAKLFIEHVNKQFPLVIPAALQSNMSSYSDHIKGDITNRLEFIRPENHTPIPIYQVLDFDGNIREEKQKPNVSSRTRR